MDDNWQLRPDLFRQIQNSTTPCTIDRFATKANALLATFNSYYFEQNTHGVDAFAQTNWGEHVNFVHPPVSILGRVVQFLEGDIPQGSRVIIVFPIWQSQPWFMQLLRMCNLVQQLPCKGNACFQKVGNFPGNDYVKNNAWQFAVGYINVRAQTIPNWP